MKSVLQLFLIKSVFKCLISFCLFKCSWNSSILLSYTTVIEEQSLTTVPLRTPITQMMFFNQGNSDGHGSDNANNEDNDQNDNHISSD